MIEQQHGDVKVADVTLIFTTQFFLDLQSELTYDSPFSRASSTKED
jgi:hypothetical protein